MEGSGNAFRTRKLAGIATALATGLLLPVCAQAAAAGVNLPPPTALSVTAPTLPAIPPPPAVPTVPALPTVPAIPTPPTLTVPGAPSVPPAPSPPTTPSLPSAPSLPPAPRVGPSVGGAPQAAGAAPGRVPAPTAGQTTASGLGRAATRAGSPRSVTPGLARARAKAARRGAPVSDLTGSVGRIVGFTGHVRGPSSPVFSGGDVATASRVGGRSGGSGRVAAAQRVSSGGIFGETLSPVARDAVLGALIAILLGAIAVALVIADNLGMGPRHRLARHWQSQRLL